MYMQSRKRKLDFSFSSFLSNSFLLFSPHFPHNLNCQSYSKRKKLTHSKDPHARASSSLTPPPEGCNEGGEEQRKGNHYEVFLSFRGPDTRKGFTDHLYNGLVNAGICAFRDDNELRQGEEIGPDLLTAIKNSKILIPIISVNYASSNWCLDELVQIMECKCNNTGTIVLPIFYKVKPSDVRCQKGSFGDGFRTRKKYSDPATLEKWKQALAKVSSLKGWEATGLEGELVKSVVQKVLSELQKKFDVVIPENLVGIDSHVKKVMKFVDNNTSATIFVGIYGMGGIGKTTLAKVIYNRLSNQFEYRSFIADTRELCKRQGLEYLQKQLIYDILQQQIKIRNKDEGISFLSSKFKGKRVLIILDDMDDDDQLKALAGNHNWFSSGSVIIITTRDKSILDNAEVDYPYEHEEMDMDSSLNLFSRHAFQKDMPPKEFEDLTDMVVSVTGGLPLSLVVLGSFLRNKELGVWEDTIKKLRNTTHKKVREKLKISYDALEYGQQQIFLDIACFFIGSDERIASYMWDACNFYPKEGIVVLRSMSLIKVGEDHKLWMHDQLRDLGRDIVRKEDEKHPQYRSRLWESEEIVEMLEEDEGTGKIEALRLYNYRRGRSYTAGKFEKLTNLRFLQMYHVNLTGKFQNLLPRLTWLKWTGDFLDFDVANCHLKKLIVLDLSWGCGKISEHWEGWDLVKMATRLKVLNLTDCDLRTTPDLSVFKSLEFLILKGCYHLEKIHPSIEVIKTLITLNVNCCKLKELPLGVGRMEELRELIISGTGIQEIPISSGGLTKLEILNASSCDKLDRLPESLGSLVSLTQLYLHKTGIEELPESIGSLKKLKTLDASYCASLAFIPSSIGNLTSLSSLDLTECHKLAQLPDSIGSLVSLPRLLLSGCHSLRQIPSSIGQLTSLTEMHLKSTTIEELPESIGSLKKLETLDASYCALLARIPSSIGDLTSLSWLGLTKCHKLAQLPNSIGSLVSLRYLLLSGCHSLRQIPSSIGQLTSLTVMYLQSTAIEELPESIGSWKKLETLDASYCSMLACIPSSIGDLTSLSSLDLTECHKLAQLPDSIGSLVSLSRLLLSGCHSLRQIPSSIGQLTSLTKMHLKSTAVEELPESIGSLKELETLDASSCASLAFLPSSIGNLTSLSHLDLTECHKLAQLPDSIGSLVSLQHLLLSGCHSLRQLPDSIGKLTSLIEMHLKYTAMMELPESIGDMRNLRILDISGTPIVELLDDRGIVTELQGLRTSRWKNLGGLPGYTSQLVSPGNLVQKLSELRSRVLALVLLKHPRTTPAKNLAMEYQTSDSEHVLKRSRTFGISDEPPAITVLNSSNATAGASPDDRRTPKATMDSETMVHVNTGMANYSEDKSRIWELTEINEPSQCRSIRLPDNLTTARVSKLKYTNSGLAILALSSNAVHKLWKWKSSDRNATTSVVPELWQPPGAGILMTNDTSDTNPEDAVPCFALSRNDNYLISASGGKISFFNITTFTKTKQFMPQPAASTILASHRQGIDIIAIGMEDSSIQIDNVRVDEEKLKGRHRIIKGFDFSTFFSVIVSSGSDSQTMTTFVPARQAATSLAFLPRDNNIIAIGTKDSFIHIYNTMVKESVALLRGHQARITGLAFSRVLNVLVSSGADSQLHVWGTDGWEKQASKFLPLPTGRGAAPLSDTRVQFHGGQIHLLVVHETQITIYEAPKLECLKQWVPREASCPITDATYSCNGQSIYVSFEDGSIGVLTASTFILRCRINPAAYITPSPSLRVYPLVIAAHPSEPGQFALGLTDGSVYVLEPLESEGKWGASDPAKNGAGPSTTSGTTDSDQPQSDFADDDEEEDEESFSDSDDDDEESDEESFSD